VHKEENDERGFDRGNDHGGPEGKRTQINPGDRDSSESQNEKGRQSPDEDQRINDVACPGIVCVIGHESVILF
jgi:hypothetical protein